MRPQASLQPATPTEIPKRRNRTRHHQESSVACKKFLAIKEKPPIVAYPIHQLIINALEEVTTDHDRCRFCESVIADMKVHMTESQACNRMAYVEFKKKI